MGQTVQGLVIYPDASFEYTAVELDHKAIQAIVGGIFETIVTPRAILYYDEYGKDRHVKINEMATYLLRQLVPAAEVGKDFLPGPVLVTGPPVNGEETDLDPRVKSFWEQMVAAATAAPAP